MRDPFWLWLSGVNLGAGLAFLPSVPVTACVELALSLLLLANYFGSWKAPSGADEEGK